MSVEIFDKPISINKPDLIVSLRDLNSPAELYQLCRDNKLSHFGYGFRFARNSYSVDQIKFGYSAPNPSARSSVQQGERLVRQAAWLPGWPERVHSDHGYALWDGCKSLIAEGVLPCDTNYADFEIAVWSVDTRKNISGITANRKEIAKCIESMLCEQYKQEHGKLPHLNIADPTDNKLFKTLTKSTISLFFSYADD